MKGGFQLTDVKKGEFVCLLCLYVKPVAVAKKRVLKIQKYLN